LSGKCLFGQRPRAHPPSSNMAHIHRAKKCLFQTHHQSPSAMTRNNYLIFVLIGWLPGCGYISARGKRNNIPSVCARIYTNAKGIPCRFCAGCFRLTARLIDDHNSTSYTQNTPPPTPSILYAFPLTLYRHITPTDHPRSRACTIHVVYFSLATTHTRARPLLHPLAKKLLSASGRWTNHFTPTWCIIIIIITDAGDRACVCVCKHRPPKKYSKTQQGSGFWRSLFTNVYE